MHLQIVALGAAGVLLTAATTLALTLSKAPDELISRITFGLITGGLIAIGLIVLAASRLLRPIHALQTEVEHAKRDHAASQQVLDQRTQTVDRLLDFSQTIQGVGKADQV